MAGELLASIDDINTHLAKANSIADSVDNIIQVDTNRLIKAMLAGVFQPTTLSSWASPSTTPGLIRSIAGRLCAAKWYANQFSEDSTDIPAFAQNLYNEALSIIAQIVSGNMTVLDDDDNPIESDVADSDLQFYPDDSIEPYFTMGQRFG